MSSGALSSFPQTGTFDWFRLGAGAITFLAHVNNYDVPPYTMILGARIGSMIPLSDIGQKRVSDAINGLREYRSLDDALSFGSGPTSMVRLLGSHADGLALVAISAALSEVYDENVTASVLRELMLFLEQPLESTPLLQSWLKVVKACASTLALTHFSLRAEEMMRWHPTETALASEALVEMGKISRKEIDSVTIVGGGDTGFLAAVAEWLYGMNIVILDSKLETIYFNSKPELPVQVRFIYKDRTAMPSSDKMQLGLIQSTSKVIHLKDVSDVVWAQKEKRSYENVANGRLPWETCLSDAFGNTYANLKAHGAIFGNALGYAARVFEAVAKAELGTDIETRKNWIYYTDAGSGFGYVLHLISQFPELKAFKVAIEQGAAEADHQKARKEYGGNIGLLAQLCECHGCISEANKRAPAKWCAVVVVETILQAGLILSNVLVEPGLNPRRSGFEYLYEKQIDARSAADEIGAQGQRPMEAIDWVIEPERWDDYLYKIDHRVRSMVDRALGLFTNLQNEIEHDSSCAFVENGICAYRICLGNLAVHDDTGVSLARVHILPGHIIWQNTRFSRLQDLFVEQPDDDWIDENEKINMNELNFGKASLVLEESRDQLRVSFELPNSKGRLLYILPTYATNEVLGAHGLVTCRHRPNTFRKSQATGEESNFQVLDLNGKQVTIYRAPPGPSAIAALTVTTTSTSQYDVLCNNKCVECALETASIIFYSSRKPLLIVSY